LLTYLILIFLGLGGLILWTGLRLQTAIVGQAEHELEFEALVMANALREPLEKWYEGKDPGGRSLKAVIESYARQGGVRVTGINPSHTHAQDEKVRVTLLDPSLRMLMSSDEAVPIHVEEEHPELAAARRGWEQHDTRWDEWRNEERLFVAAPIMEIEEGETELEGFVQLSVLMTSLYAEMRRT
jgi:hypothetical protein